MKKRVLMGVVMAMVALLMISCNKNRFDFDNLNSVEGSGQWKLPIGSANITLRQVFAQLGENDLISYDENGNLQIKYSYEMTDVLKGSNFLNLGSLNFSSSVSFDNPFPGVALPEPIDTVFRFSQVLKIESDSAMIESAIIKSGDFLCTLQSNLGNVSEVLISSPDITMPDGDTLHTVNNMVDLAGASFRLHDDYGVADTTLTLNYAISYQLTGIDDPMYEVTTIIGLNNLKLQELSGTINQFVYEFELDTTFSLPLDGINGQMSLVGTDIQINERNTFENLYALLQIDYAELYGGNAVPSPIFNNYPFMLNIIPSNTYVNMMEGESINLSFSTEYDAVRVKGNVDFNPAGVDRLVVIRDTSVLSLKIDAVVPMMFNIEEVTYNDTIDLNLSGFSPLSLIKEIVLDMLFDSKIPFNLRAQFYGYNSQTGVVSDELLDNALLIKGSFDGNSVLTDDKITLTNEKVQALMESDKLIMRFKVDTDHHDVLLNLDNALGVTLKADVIYEGTVDINN